MHTRARTFFRDLRGSEATSVLSARLGYKTDIVAEWESGTQWPTAGEFFRVCAACRIDVPAAMARFSPVHADDFGSGSDREIAAWLNQVCDRPDPRRLAKRLGRSTTAVRRWLGGQVRPTLPELLGLLAHSAGRAEDFLNALLPEAETPSQSDPDVTDDRGAARRRGSASHESVSQALKEARALRAATPGIVPPRTSLAGTPSHQEEDEEEGEEVTVEVFGLDTPPDQGPSDTERLLRAIDSHDYRTLGRHRPGWLEARLGLESSAIEDGLRSLEDADRIRFERDRWTLVQPLPPGEAAEHAPEPRTPLERLVRRRGAHMVVSISAADLTRVRGLKRRTRAELTAIAASTRKKEVLALVRVHP